MDDFVQLIVDLEPSGRYNILVLVGDAEFEANVSKGNMFKALRQISQTIEAGGNRYNMQDCWRMLGFDADDDATEEGS